MAANTLVWFIIAACNGFGKYMALEARLRGHRVIATARSISRIADLEEAGAETIVLNVTSLLADIKKVAKEEDDEYRYINHVVNAT